MQRIVMALTILALAGLGIYFMGATHLRVVPTPGPKADQSKHDQSFWPLAPRTHWTYQVRPAERGKKLEYYVQEIEKDGAILVLENTDGKQTDNFRVRTGPGQKASFQEHQTKGTPAIVWLPDDFEVGTRWNLSKTWKAVVADEEEITLPAFDGPRTALRVEYEKMVPASFTSSPGWYGFGTRWFVRGVGLVREDLEEISGPPDAIEFFDSSRRHLELTKFVAPWKKAKTP